VRILFWERFAFAGGGSPTRVATQAQNLHRQEQSLIKAKDFELQNFWTLVVVMIGVERWKRFLRLCYGAESRVVCEWQIVGTEENSVRRHDGRR
jgi:hypothetical protein